MSKNKLYLSILDAGSGIEVKEIWLGARAGGTEGNECNGDVSTTSVSALSCALKWVLLGALSLSWLAISGQHLRCSGGAGPRVVSPPAYKWEILWRHYLRRREPRGHSLQF